MRPTRSRRSRVHARTGMQRSGRRSRHRSRERAAPRGRSSAASRHRRGMLTGRRPLGFTRPLSTPATAGAALFAGEERLHDRGGLVDRAGRARRGARPAGSAPWGCRCRAPRRRAAAARRAGRATRRRSPRRSCRGRTGPARSPSARIATSADAATAAASAMPSVSPPSTLVPRAQRISLAGNSVASASSRVGMRMPSSTPGMLRHHVRGERVAAEHGVGVVGVRADDRDDRRARRAAACRRCARARSPRSASSRASARLPAESRSIEPRSVSACVRSAAASAGGTGDQSASSRPSSAFCRSTRRRARVDERHVDGARLDREAQRFAERLHRGQLDVDAGVERGLGRLGPGAGRAVQQLQERDREVVGDDGAVEAPRLAQQPGEQ